MWAPTFSLFHTQSDNMTLGILIQPKQYSFLLLVLVVYHVYMLLS